jgi:cellulose synthase operon protein YhjQ
MTEHNAPPDPKQTPEDVASLYSWANLHGSKYRDFTASRAQTREAARHRMEQAIEEERQRARRETDSQRQLQEQETQRAAEIVLAQEEARREEVRRAELAAQQAAQQAVREAAERAAQQAAQELARQTTQQTAQQAAQPATRAADERVAWQQPRPEPAAAPAHLPPSSAQQVPVREESYMPPQRAWAPQDNRDNPVRPAWLTPEPPAAVPVQPALPAGDGDSLQGSRERLASRWYSLRAIFDEEAQPAQPAQAPAPARAPVLAVFSLAGGVGKTSLVATLGRVLSSRGERVLLVDTAAYGLLPFFFGAHDQRPGQLRTFTPPAASGDAQIQMITLDPENYGNETSAPEALNAEILKHARGLSRVMIDLATASGATTRRVMRLAPQVLVPLAPDMGSVVSVSSIDAFFDHNGTANGKTALPYYVLNQFDPSLPLHLDVREVLREQIGDRLLPFVLRHSPAVSEALAEGMTVIDYAPNSTVAEDYANLAGWVKSLSAPASSSFRGVRWSER